MSNFNFLTTKSSFHCEPHKFEYFSQPSWDIQVCEKIKFMERWKRNGLYRNIRRTLHKAWYENWPIWNWKKSYRLVVKFIWIYIFSMFGNDIKFKSVSIWNSAPNMSCSAHVCSTGLMTHFISFHSHVQRSNKCIFIFVYEFPSLCF